MAGSHDHAHADAGVRALAYAFGINTVFFGVELAGALYAGSLALLANAVHMATDSLSIGLALFAAWVATRPADPQRTYGYERVEVLAALANGVFLLGTVGYILFEAVGRFADPAAIRPGAVVAVGVSLLFTDYLIIDPLFAVLIAAVILYSTKDLLTSSSRRGPIPTPSSRAPGEDCTSASASTTRRSRSSRRPSATPSTSTATPPRTTRSVGRGFGSDKLTL